RVHREIRVEVLYRFVALPSKHLQLVFESLFRSRVCSHSLATSGPNRRPPSARRTAETGHPGAHGVALRALGRESSRGLRGERSNPRHIPGTPGTATENAR